MNDVINRVDAINAVCNAGEDATDGDYIRALYAIPSADSWVSCNESLPPEKTYVIAYNVELGFSVFARYDRGSRVWCDNVSDSIKYDSAEITHWKQVSLFPPTIKE